jgi:hypothetical protein
MNAVTFFLQLRRNVDKRSLEIGEIARIEHLGTRIMLPIKRVWPAGHPAFTASAGELNHRPK